MLFVCYILVFVQIFITSLQTWFEAPVLLQQLAELLGVHEVCCLPLSAVLSSWNGPALATYHGVQLCGCFFVFYVFIVGELLSHLVLSINPADLLNLCLLELVVLQGQIFVSFLRLVELASDERYARLVMERGIVCVSLRLQQALLAVADVRAQVCSFRAEEVEFPLTAFYFVATCQF